MVGSVSEVVEWLADGARSAAQSHEVLKTRCEDLLACGIPLWRVGVFVRTRHPDVFGRSFVWRPGMDVIVRTAPHTITSTDEYIKSPVVMVYEKMRPVRYRLTGPPGDDEMPFLAEMRAEGVT